MWHKTDWMGHPVRLELTPAGWLVKLANATWIALLWPNIITGLVMRNAIRIYGTAYVCFSVHLSFRGKHVLIYRYNHVTLNCSYITYPINLKYIETHVRNAVILVSVGVFSWALFEKKKVTCSLSILQKYMDVWGWFSVHTSCQEISCFSQFIYLFDCLFIYILRT